MSLTFKEFKTLQALMHAPVSLGMKQRAMGLSAADIREIQRNIHHESLSQKREHDFEQWKKDWGVVGKFCKNRLIELCLFCVGMVAGYFLF